MNNIGNRKSLDQYREVWINLANNHRYAKYVDEVDLLVFSTRLANEGITFLTHTLPSLGKALDSYFSIQNVSCVKEAGKTASKYELVQLMGEFVGPDDFSKSPDGIPHFLGKAFEFALRGDSLAVDCVRQLSYIFYKLEVDYDQDVVESFLTHFKEVDEGLSLFTPELLKELPIVDRARLIIRRVLCNSDPLDIRPRHGSGATACQTPNHAKWHTLRYYPKLDAVFSYPDYFFYSYDHLIDDYGDLEKSVESDPMARVCLVPKDSRGPRIISCEPAELMFIQQGLMRKLYEILGTHHLTKGYINFVDQGVNQELAHEASLTGRMATLDLTDASDRVSLNLVRELFPENWVAAFEACRSERTKLPNGEVVELQKFAPMGSSCCFPVEALVFWAIACASTWRLTRKSEVFVYGDDIIVPTDLAGTVIDGLESVGLLVNRSKSYASGPFRESCGGEYHNGYDVTPVRMRKALCSSSSSITTDSDLANNFIAKFGEGEVLRVISVIDNAHTIPLPRSSMQLPCCVMSESRASNDVFYRRRWNFHLQRFEHRIPRVVARALALREPNWFELLRKELTRGTSGNTPDKYANPLLIQEAALEPGFYVDAHTTATIWAWTWLG